MDTLNFVKRHYHCPMVEVVYEDENGRKHKKIMQDVTDLVDHDEEIKADATRDVNFRLDPVELV